MNSKTNFFLKSLLITTLYSMSNMQGNMNFYLKKKFIYKKNHLNVVLFSISHSSGKYYVAI